jgi:hypothetical protein
MGYHVLIQLDKLFKCFIVYGFISDAVGYEFQLLSCCDARMSDYSVYFVSCRVHKIFLLILFAVVPWELICVILSGFHELLLQ